MRRIKYLHKKNLIKNYNFLSYFLKSFCDSKKNNFKNLYFLKNINKISIFPQYAIYKNVLNKKIAAKNVLKKNKTSVFFFKNEYTKNYGLNYYIFLSKENKHNINNLIEDLKEESNFNLIQFKDFNYNFNYDFNYNFNYDLNFINILEIYKILIYLHINKII